MKEKGLGRTIGSTATGKELASFFIKPAEIVATIHKSSDGWGRVGINTLAEKCRALRISRLGLRRWIAILAEAGFVTCSRKYGIALTSAGEKFFKIVSNQDPLSGMQPLHQQPLQGAPA